MTEYQWRAHFFWPEYLIRDTERGAEKVPLGEYEDLSAGGYATPSTYEAGGRQYVVIAADDAGLLNVSKGDAIVAFALP